MLKNIEELKQYAFVKELLTSKISKQTINLFIDNLKSFMLDPKFREKFGFENKTYSRNEYLSIIREIIGHNKFLTGLLRNKFNKIVPVYSSSNAFLSERNLDFSNTAHFGEGWIPEREIRIMPLFVSNEKILNQCYSNDYKLLPKELTDTLKKGILRTSGEQSTDFSALMVSTIAKDGMPEGRTGTLIFRGTPLVIDIKGKEFIVEIKGIGSPDGNNKKTKEMIRDGYFGQTVKRYGCATEGEGRREFRNLEIQRKEGSKTFLNGDAVRAAALFIYKNDVDYGYKNEQQNQAYLIRLSPGNIRASYSFGRIPLNPEEIKKIVGCIGNHYTELANLPSTILHSTIHPENFVRTANGFVLTDMADCRKLDEIDNPLDFLTMVLVKIKEVKGITEAQKEMFYSVIAKNLGTHLGGSGGYSEFIEAIWNDFFSQKVYKLRKGSKKFANEQIESHKKIVELRRSNNFKSWQRIDLKWLADFLKGEERLLKNIKSQVAQRSLDLARQRIRMCEGTINVSAWETLFEESPNSYYDLFYLPYMD